ncbi:hypothetical protein FDUTEX481_04377 [Tolypothrix sp. PCC 7601]|nr:hypothetical protein FDUTEX481_04377 [Tolypothrix sp. PCC 7601]
MDGAAVMVVADGTGIAFASVLTFHRRNLLKRECEFPMHEIYVRL